MKGRIAKYQEGVPSSLSATALQPPVRITGEILVELKDVNVSYHERKVSAARLVYVQKNKCYPGVAKYELDDPCKRKMAPPGIKWCVLAATDGFAI